MSYYRDTYLKSEHWDNLRIAALAFVDAKCAGCGVRCISNDVHHLNYGESIFEVKVNQLMVLCRSCHGIVHELIEKHPELRGLHQKKLRKITAEALRTEINIRAEMRRKAQVIAELPSLIRMFTGALQEP